MTSSKITLTKEQLEAWADFVDPLWDAFKDAWLARGLRTPPPGDHADQDQESIRSMVYAALQDFPTLFPRWISEAPKGLHPAKVIQFCFARLTEWKADRSAQIDQEEAAGRAGPDRFEAAAVLAAIEEYGAGS